MNNKAKKIREYSLMSRKRQPSAAELQKALDLCLMCLNNVKPTISSVGVVGYIDATIKAAKTITTRN